MINNNSKRKLLNVHLGRKKRKTVRNLLVSIFGTKCCWCGIEMEIPKTGKHIRILENMATIEHYFAKQFGYPSNILLMRLSHKKCNK